MKLKDFTKINLDNTIKQDASDFLDKLPPELRNRIYELVLSKDVVPVRAGRRNRKRLARCQAPPILISCKQIYAEAVKLYWMHSAFLFRAGYYDPEPGCWLTKIGRRRRELLTDVRIENKAGTMNHIVRTSTMHPKFNYAGCSFKPSPLFREVRGGNQQLGRCGIGPLQDLSYISVKGVAPGVIKVGLLLPSKEKPGMCAKEVTWTQTPEETAAPYLKDR